MTSNPSEDRGFDFIVVANRLPVDRDIDAEGNESWRQSPGGLVTALVPTVLSTGGAWIGWPGQSDLELEPFNHEGIHLVPLALSEEEYEGYYEGFSNDTIWPLYHDVIVSPSYHRAWWETFEQVNRRFAEAAAELANEGAVVWVHDYQLQLVPGILRELRPDLTIGYFNHIPFPAYELYSQLPWRRQIIGGLLGADVVGFQRTSDASNFARAVRRLFGHTTRGTQISVPAGTTPARTVIARAFPISIDANEFERLARTPEIQQRAHEIREHLGNPRSIILGVDRLDYTKGIGHRLKAFGEMLADGTVSAEDVTLVQVASPSREKVDSYKQLRDEIELTVGRLNGDFGTIRNQPVNYLHHSYPRDEMVALYLAADVMLVTPLRDGMNLVAKEYAAVRYDDDGVLVLSEFTGASDELRTAVRVNPHDIAGLKVAIEQALAMPRSERRRRMRALRRRVFENDVAKWSTTFLGVLMGDRE